MYFSWKILSVPALRLRHVSLLLHAWTEPVRGPAVVDVLAQPVSSFGHRAVEGDHVRQRVEQDHLDRRHGEKHVSQTLGPIHLCTIERPVGQSEEQTDLRVIVRHGLQARLKRC